MKLRTVDVVILLIFGLLCITRATWGLFKDIYIDLSKAKSVAGKVIYADIIQTENVTLKIKKHSTVFAIRLDNSTQKFAIDRGVEVCNFLKSEIEIGDSIKLLYRLSSSNDHNTFVYQIEKDEKILANFSDYRKKEARMIILGFIFGFIILAILAYWYFKKKLAPHNHRPLVKSSN